MLDTEVSSILLSFLHGFLEDASWVCHSQLRYTWEFIGVLEVRLLGTFVCIFVVYLSVHASLRLVLDPFTDEELVLRVVEVTSLAFALVADPVTFEVVAISLGQDSVAVALALVPLTFVNVLV